MADTLTETFHQLDKTQQLFSLLNFLVPQNTRNVRDDIMYAREFEVNYVCNQSVCNFKSVLDEVRNNSKFNETGQQKLLINFLETIDTHQTDFSVNRMNHFIFKSSGFPILMLTNKTSLMYKHVDGFSKSIEIDNMRNHLYKKYHSDMYKKYYSDTKCCNIEHSVLLASTGMIGYIIYNAFSRR